MPRWQGDRPAAAGGEERGPPKQLNQLIRRDSQRAGDTSRAAAAAAPPPAAPAPRRRRGLPRAARTHPPSLNALLPAQGAKVPPGSQPAGWHGRGDRGAQAGKARVVRPAAPAEPGTFGAWAAPLDPRESPESPGARFRRRLPVDVRDVPDLFHQLFGKIGVQSLQRSAGTGIPGIIGGPAAPARLQGSSGRGAGRSSDSGGGASRALAGRGGWEKRQRTRTGRGAHYRIQRNGRRQDADFPSQLLS
eukprot:gene24130-biopygen1327